jgi:hypothetical protein
MAILEGKRYEPSSATLTEQERHQAEEQRVLEERRMAEQRPFAPERREPEERPPFREVAKEVAVTESMAQSIAGIAAVVLSILGLAGLYPAVMIPVATLALGAAFLFEGWALGFRYSHALWQARLQYAHGMTTEFLAGAVSITLGILSLLGVLPVVLPAVAVIVFGSALLLGSPTRSRINALLIEESRANEKTRAMAHDATTAAAGVHMLMGVGAIALGIIALSGVYPSVITLVALLALGFTGLVSGTAIGGTLMRVFRR